MKKNKIEEALENPIEITKELNKDGKEIKVESENITKDEKLTPRQEKFCQLYALDSSCFGNGVTTYMEIYDIDKTKKGRYNNACSCASQLLSNPKVYNRINELLEEQGLNDEFVDKQTLFLISQHTDFGSKARMISEYNKVKGRITDKIEHSGNINISKKDLEKLSDDELEKIANEKI